MMQDSEVSLIIRSISENVKTYEQVVEVRLHQNSHLIRIKDSNTSLA